jgi:hypothetical protein
MGRVPEPPVRGWRVRAVAVDVAGAGDDRSTVLGGAACGDGDGDDDCDCGCLAPVAV